MTRKLLFVCLGNICRSPTAEGVFRQVAGQGGLDLVIDSAGTSDWHAGDPPYGPAVQAAAARGYDLTDLRARQVTGHDFGRFDLILGMDEANLVALERLRPAGSTTRVQLFLDYAPETGQREVPDPYYTRDFDQALDLVEAASRGLVAALSARR